MLTTRAVLERHETGTDGTFGVLQYDGYSWFTGELGWYDNANDISCIPAGTYKCLWTYSPRFKKNVYLVNNVPSRTGVRIHPANFMGDDRKGKRRQLNGCIALGKKLGVMEGQKAVLVSRPAIVEFENLMAGQPFQLEIRDVVAVNL